MSPIPQDPSQADPSIISLMHGVVGAEGTRGDPSILGDRGTAAGIGQWSNQINGVPQKLAPGQVPANFQNDAKQYGLDPNDFSLGNQNKVLYASLASDKARGLSPEEVLSKWNSGRPDAYANPATSTGTGSVGAYDVAAYVKRGMSAAQQYAQQQKGVSEPPPETTPPTTQTPKDPTSLLSNLINWAFPIAGDVSSDLAGSSSKTPLQQLGDLGLSALWFAPGVGEGAEAAIRGTGLLGEAGSKIAGQALGGAAVGYGSDVAGKLAQGQTDAGQVLTPGAGTLTGGILGGIGGKLASKYGTEGVIKDTANSNNSIFGQWKGSANDLAESFAKGKNPGQLAAQKGLNLASMYNPETIAYETKPAAQSALSDAATLDKILTESLQRTPGSATATDLEGALMQKVAAGAPDKITAAERQAAVTDFFQKVRNTYGENLTLPDLNELKGRAWTDSVFDGVKTNTERSTNRIIGNTLKTTIEDKAKQGGLDGVNEMNQYIGSHYDLADMLNGIHGNKAKGGRLGDILTRHTGGAVGAGIGALFGGGPVGSIIGLLAGEWGGARAASIMRRIGAAPIRSALLKRVIQEDPEIVQKMTAYAKGTSRGAAATEEAAKTAPSAQKKPGTSGLLGKAIITGATRLASQ